MKMRKPHWVPLARQVVEILKAQREISGEGRYVFPGNRSERRPMSDGALGAALAMLGYKKGGWMTVDAQQPHGFRVSFSSLMNGANADPKIIEACLAHGSPDKVAAIYNRAQYKPERRALMHAWADLIDKLKEKAGTSPASVSLPTAAAAPDGVCCRTNPGPCRLENHSHRNSSAA
jgi:integrase